MSRLLAVAFTALLLAASAITALPPLYKIVSMRVGNDDFAKYDVCLTQKDSRFGLSRCDKDGLSKSGANPQKFQIREAGDKKAQRENRQAYMLKPYSFSDEDPTEFGSLDKPFVIVGEEGGKRWKFVDINSYEERNSECWSVDKFNPKKEGVQFLGQPTANCSTSDAIKFFIELVAAENI